jgi:beta-glucanase (GH16 family)/cytochrome c oxidase assembly protein Cox11
MIRKPGKRGIAGLLAAVLTATLFTGAAAAESGGRDGGGDRHSGPQPDRWKLAWNDEFNDGVIDPRKWTFDIGTGAGGWGNNELEYYTNRPENVKETDGKLVITARKENYQGSSYTSAKIKTAGLFSKVYGKYEIRAKAPAGKGFWPAIWMMPEESKYGSWAASGELDIFEGWGSRPNTVAGTLHYGQQWPGNTYTGKEYVLPGGSTIEDFHTYGIEWEPGEIRWYVDGKLYQTQNDWYSRSLYQPADNTYPAPFDEPFYLIMNLAVGGNFDGNPDGTTVFPKSMEIDYVRVYDLVSRPYREPVPPAVPKDPLPADARQPLPDGNLVYNGQFNQDDPNVPNLGDVPNTDYWRLFTGEGGNGTVSIENVNGSNFAKLGITAGGNQPYSVQLLNDVSIAKGRFYKLTFDAKAADVRTMGVKLTGGPSRGFAAYSPAQTFQLTKDVKHYELAFQMKQDTDIAARTEFNAGLDNKAVWIGNVRLEEIDGIPIYPDAPKTPLDGDGNHVYNGTFDQGDQSRMMFWHILEEGGAKAKASVDPAERKLNVEVKDKGKGRGHDRKGPNGSVAVQQKGIQLIKDMEYLLTFDAQSDKLDLLEVALESKDGTVHYANKDIQLSRKNKTYSFAFKMEHNRDNESQLLFLLKDKGELKLDNVKLIRTSVYYEPDVVFYPLANGNFTHGLAPWVTATDSGGAVTGAPDNGEAKLTVTAQGANPWSNMFIYNGLKLFKGVPYELDFDIRASADRKIEFALENSAYFRYLNQTVDVSPSSQHFHYEFVMPNDDTVSLKYFLGLIQGTSAVGSNHDVWLDNIDLKVNDAPSARPPQLVPDASDNQVGEPITLSFTDDPAWRSSVTAVKIGETALSSGQYLLAAGSLKLDAALFPAPDTYLVTVEAGGYAAASVQQDIASSDGNLIRNGSFSSGTANWASWSDQGSVFAVDNGAAKVEIYSIGGANWSTQLYQENIALAAGKTYRLSFNAWSSANRPIRLEFSNTPIPEAKFDVTSDTAQVYTSEFSVTSDQLLKLNFCIGNVINGGAATPSAAHTLFFDNLKLVEIPAAPTGHALLNGTFDTDVSSWSSYVADGSDASLSVEAGRLKIGFANYDGWFPWSTQVYQDHLQLDAGKTYTVSFEAEATEAKDIIFSVENAPDFNLKYLSAQAITLTPGAQTYTYEFTMGAAADANAKLLFQMGSNNATGPHFNGQSVYLDNIKLAEKTAPAPTGTNLRNGTFDTDTSQWNAYIADGSDAALSVDAGRLKISFANYDGWFPWSTQVYQDQLRLDAGKTYMVSFDAESTEAKDMIFSIENTADFNIKYLGAQAIPLTPGTQTYTYSFTMGASSDTNVKLLFQLGSNNATGPHFNGQNVYIDNITLAEV